MPNASTQVAGNDGHRAVGNGARTHVQTINGRGSLVVTPNGMPPTDKHATRDATAQNGVPTLGAGAEDVDWNQFVNEIRRLYRQLEQTMKNNNLLRAKLDERLTQGGVDIAGSRTSIGPVEGRDITDTDFTRDAGKLRRREGQVASSLFACIVSRQ